MSRTACRAHRKAILEGTVLAMDPSSGSFNQKKKEQSYPGYALFREGELVESGVVDLNGQELNIWERLRELYDCLENDFDVPDVLIIERIRGRVAHQYLKWSVGIIGTAVRAPVVIEMPVSTWRSFAGKDHEKSDENDAIAIGTAAVKLARGE